MILNIEPLTSVLPVVEFLSSLRRAISVKTQDVYSMWSRYVRVGIGQNTNTTAAKLRGLVDDQIPPQLRVLFQQGLVPVTSKQDQTWLLL